MHIIKKTLLLLALSQLGACAVISKEQCLNADWRQIGYDIGSNGNNDKQNAFEKRKRACEKHNTTADWQQFELGHSDGIIDFCQLGNAVKLGVNGASSVVNKNICTERDYPGFREAFSVGYKLYVLNTAVNERDLDISQSYSQINHHKTSIQRINKKLSTKGLDKDVRNHLINERRTIRSDIKYLIRGIDWNRERLHHALYIRDQYSDYLYHDYMINLNDQFVDPRNKKNVNIKNSNF